MTGTLVSCGTKLIEMDSGISPAEDRSRGFSGDPVFTV